MVWLPWCVIWYSPNQRYGFVGNENGLGTARGTAGYGNSGTATGTAVSVMKMVQVVWQPVGQGAGTGIGVTKPNQWAGNKIKKNHSRATTNHNIQWLLVQKHLKFPEK